MTCHSDATPLSRQLVCPKCHGVEPLSQGNISAMRARQAVRCRGCAQDNLRFKVML